MEMLMWIRMIGVNSRPSSSACSRYRPCEEIRQVLNLPRHESGKAVFLLELYQTFWNFADLWYALGWKDWLAFCKRQAICSVMMSFQYLTKLTGLGECQQDIKILNPFVRGVSSQTGCIYSYS